MQLDQSFARDVLAQAMGTLMAALTLYLGGVIVGSFEAASLSGLLLSGAIWIAGLIWSLLSWRRAVEGLRAKQKQRDFDEKEALRIATPKDVWSVQAIWGKDQWDQWSDEQKGGNLYMFSDAGIRVRAMRKAEGDRPRKRKL